MLIFPISLLPVSPGLYETACVLLILCQPTAPRKRKSGARHISESFTQMPAN
jgi:hypothetical protein